MGELFRSREVDLVQIYIQLDAIHDTLEELGNLGLVQFRDLNEEASAFQRNFVNEVKRTDELQRTLRYFSDQIEMVLIRKPNAFMYIDDEEDGLETVAPRINNLDSLESYFEELEAELRQIEESQKILNQNYFELTEMKHVLTQADTVFDKEEDIVKDEAQGGLGHLAGIVHREKIFTFEKLLWRATRGNLYFRHIEVPEPILNPIIREYEEKNVFIIFYQGQNTKIRMERLCGAFDAPLYPCPTNPTERRNLLSDIETRITELRTVLDKSSNRQRNLLADVYRYGTQWKEFIIKEKAIYHTMNMFEYDVGRHCLIAEGWCPTEYLPMVQQALQDGNDRSKASVPSVLSVLSTNRQKPTFQKTNDFTRAFQDIVDMYGVARYQEVNPGVFTIITFPFLFGVMFGDVGHGFLLLLAALAMLGAWKLAKNPSEEFLESVSTKWLILLMALFSIYCGFMYNECFSMPMSIFSTNWTYGDEITPDEYASQIDPSYVYPFGVDPLWMLSKNSLDYYNSLKMKMSISIGVAQMTLGICLSLLNYRFFKDTKRIFCDFIPQLLFLWSIFGYMCFLIFLKWTIQWEDASRAPRILNLITEMILSPWVLSEEFTMFYGQHFVQVVLLLVAAICIPWMLFAKPLVIMRERKRRYEVVIAGDIPLAEMSEDGKEISPGEDFHTEEFEEHAEDDHEPEEISEVFIIQGIHTIEFILGCVSNTASYLRLWALSLAHSELSAVFWERVLLMGLQSQSTLMIFAAWSIWAVLTVGVLMGMESLSAFLHALRLHWVEFQNKFYSGDGYKFTPFSFRVILNSEEDLLQ